MPNRQYSLKLDDISMHVNNFVCAPKMFINALD